MRIDRTYGTSTFSSWSYSGFVSAKGYKGDRSTTSVTAGTSQGHTDAWGDVNDTSTSNAGAAGIVTYKVTHYHESWTYKHDKSRNRTTNEETVADFGTTRATTEVNSVASCTTYKATIPYTALEGPEDDPTAVKKTSYINDVSCTELGANTNTYIGRAYGGITWLQKTKEVTIDYLRSTYVKDTLSESYWNNEDTSYRTYELALLTHVPSTTTICATYSTRGRHPKVLGDSIFTGFSQAVTTRYSAEYREYLKTRSPESLNDESGGEISIFKVVSRSQEYYNTPYTKLYDGTFTSSELYSFRTDVTSRSTEATIASLRHVPTTEYIYYSSKKLTWTEWTWDYEADLVTEYSTNPYVTSHGYVTTISTEMSRKNSIRESFVHTLDVTEQITKEDENGDTYTRDYVRSNFAKDAIKLDETSIVLLQETRWETTEIHKNRNDVIQTQETTSTQYYTSDHGGYRSKVTAIGRTYRYTTTSAGEQTYRLGTADDRIYTRTIVFSRSNSSSFPASSSSSSVGNGTRTVLLNGETFVENYTYKDVDWNDATMYQSYSATGQGVTSFGNTVEFTAQTYAPLIFVSTKTYKTYEITDPQMNRGRLPDFSQWKTTYFLPKFAESITDEIAKEIAYTSDCKHLPVRAKGVNIYGHNILDNPTDTIYVAWVTKSSTRLKTSSSTWSREFISVITKQETETLNSDATAVYPKRGKNKIYITTTETETAGETYTNTYNIEQTATITDTSYYTNTDPFFTSTIPEMFVSMSLFGKDELSEYSDYDTSVEFPITLTRNTLDNSVTGTYSSSYSTTSLSMRDTSEMSEYVHQERVYDHVIKSTSFLKTNYKYSVALTSTTALETKEPQKTHIVFHGAKFYGTSVMGGWNFNGQKLTASLINRHYADITVQTAKIHYTHTGTDKWRDLVLTPSETLEYAFDGSYCTQMRRQPLITNVIAGQSTDFGESISIGEQKFPDPHRPMYFSFKQDFILSYVPKETSDKYFSEFWQTGMLAGGLVYFPYTSKDDAGGRTEFTFFDAKEYLELQKKINNVKLF